MSIAAVPALTSVETQIDDLLARIAKELQLDKTRYNNAETSYGAVGSYLDNHRIAGQFRADDLSALHSLFNQSSGDFATR